MVARPSRAFGLVLAGGLAGALLARPALAQSIASPRGLSLLVIGLLVAALAYLCALSDPAWALSGALALSTLSGNWHTVGLPSSVAPDRILLLVGLGALLLRAPGAAGRPRIVVGGVHWLLFAVVVYALLSAFLTGGLLDSGAIFRLVDRYGVIPFLVFLVAPVAFRTDAQRRILLGTLIALGAYLGLMAVFQKVGPHGLVFPRAIADPSVGIHSGRARGPFLEAVSNGFGLFVCAVAAGIAVMTWRRPWARAGAGAVIVLCCVGIVLTLTRSIWIGSTLGLLTMMLVAKDLRRHIVPVAVAGAVVVVCAMTFIPGLSGQAQDRADNSSTVWERDALNVAAIGMFERYPLFGVGWNRYSAVQADYLRQGEDYPLRPISGIGVHNVFLARASELGGIGLALWAGALLVALYGALRRRAPPGLEPWRAGLAGIAVCWLVVANLVDPGSFPMLSLWLWAGLLWRPGSLVTARHA